MIKKISAFLMAITMAAALSACGSKDKESKTDTTEATVATTATEETSLIGLSTSPEDGYNTFRIMVHDSLKEKPLPEQLDPTTLTLPQELYDASVLVNTYTGYETAEDEAAANDPNTVEKPKSVFIISSDPKNNLNEFNTLTTNEDFSETVIQDGENQITVKTAINHNGALYIVMEDNVAAMQEMPTTGDSETAETEANTNVNRVDVEVTSDAEADSEAVVDGTGIVLETVAISE